MEKQKPKPTHYDLEGWRFHTASFVNACTALGRVKRPGVVKVRKSDGKGGAVIVHVRVEACPEPPAQ